MKINLIGKPEANYLTEDKIYDVIESDWYYLRIKDDQDELILVGTYDGGVFSESFHLGDEARWEVVEKYPQDDAPLSDKQIEIIKEQSSATQTPIENFKRGLFNNAELSYPNKSKDNLEE